MNFTESCLLLFNLIKNIVRGSVSLCSCIIFIDKISTRIYIISSRKLRPDEHENSCVRSRTDSEYHGTWGPRRRRWWCSSPERAFNLFQQINGFIMKFSFRFLLLFRFVRALFCLSCHGSIHRSSRWQSQPKSFFEYPPWELGWGVGSAPGSKISL